MAYLFAALLLFILGFGLLSFAGILIIRALRGIRTEREEKLEALAKKYFEKYVAETEKTKSLPSKRPVEHAMVAGEMVPVWKVDRRELNRN